MFVVCPCCFATAQDAAPHGEGPCPAAICLQEAEIMEKDAHTALMVAQKDATIATSRK